MHPTRRTVLAAGALTITAACHRRPPAAPPVDPDVALRAAAVQREAQLLATYQAVLAARPALRVRLLPLVGDHAAHLAELAGADAVGAAVTLVGDPITQLRRLELTAAAEHARDAVTASRRLAPLLASLAASCTCALEVL